MKNSFNQSGYSSRARDKKAKPHLVGIKLVAVALLFAAAVIVPTFLAQAQRSPVKVNNVSTSTEAGGTKVSITADGSLVRAQTWQDSEGYHVVIPNTVATDSVKAARGLKLRRVGTSLEILVQTKPGANVQLESSDNKLSLAINGKLDPRSLDSETVAAPTSLEELRTNREPQYAYQPRQADPPLRLSQPIVNTAPIVNPAPQSVATPAATAQNSTTESAQTGPQASIPSDTSSQVTEPGGAEAPSSKVRIQPEDDGFVASVFSGSSVLVVMVLGLFGLLVSRKLRSRQVVRDLPRSALSAEGGADEMLETPNTVQTSNNGDAGSSLVKSQSARVSSSNASTGLARQTATRLQVAGPTSLFGAYRIDQEVGKLVYGQPHRLDVLSSRAIDDRRAIETSLIKSVNSPDLDENGRRKAREALEEYGFVARQCAALLLAPDAYERSSAAKALGDIKSPAALPFLLEGLYDSESIVRNQAVMSIGELKLPSAIGALLDIARTHPDVPSALLSRTLSACSVEGLDFFDVVMPEPALLGTGPDEDIVEQITHLEPTSSVEDLPETIDDERLSQALVLVSSSDVHERAEGLKALVQFRAQSAIGAMALVARNDPEANLRSVAISSLGTINHESVFPAILIGMADEAREVRAAAARSLNRLSFDRSEAYVRVIETSDEATIINVAKACIQAGIVSQNLDRLSTSDHRQAYETFSLICLLAKARMNQPVLDAIADHSNGDVRIKAVHLLACTGQPGVYGQLRELAVKDGMREDVKTALLEALYKLEQEHAKGEQSDTPIITASEPQPNEVAVETGECNIPSEYDLGMLSVFESEPIPEVEPENQSDFEPMIEVATLEEIEE